VHFKRQCTCLPSSSPISDCGIAIYVPPPCMSMASCQPAHSAPMALRKQVPVNPASTTSNWQSEGLDQGILPRAPQSWSTAASKDIELIPAIGLSATDQALPRLKSMQFPLLFPPCCSTDCCLVTAVHCKCALNTASAARSNSFARQLCTVMISCQHRTLIRQAAPPRHSAAAATA